MTNTFNVKWGTTGIWAPQTMVTVSGQVDTQSNVTSVELQDGGNYENGVQWIKLVASTEGNADGTIVTRSFGPTQFTSMEGWPGFDQVIIWAGPVAIFQSSSPKRTSSRSSGASSLTRPTPTRP
jgi:hypothetical protein